MAEKYLSVKQAHQRLGGAISLRHLYKSIGKGKLHATRVLGKLLILESSLEALLDEGRMQGAGAPAPAPTSPARGQRPTAKSRK